MRCGCRIFLSTTSLQLQGRLFCVIRLGRREESLFFNLITQKKFTLEIQKSRLGRSDFSKKDSTISNLLITKITQTISNCRRILVNAPDKQRYKEVLSVSSLNLYILTFYKEKGIQSYYYALYVLCIYIYLYIYLSIYLYIYIYIYIYIDR